jgi:hypothetical protein
LGVFGVFGVLPPPPGVFGVFGVLGVFGVCSVTTICGAGAAIAVAGSAIPPAIAMEAAASMIFREMFIIGLLHSMLRGFLIPPATIRDFLRPRILLRVSPVRTCFK